MCGHIEPNARPATLVDARSVADCSAAAGGEREGEEEAEVRAEHAHRDDRREVRARQPARHEGVRRRHARQPPEKIARAEQ